MTATTNKVVLYSAIVSPASGGFDMYQKGEASVFPSDYSATDAEAQWDNEQEAINEFIAESGDIEETDELDGRVYDQNGAKIYKQEQDGVVTYTALWTEEV